ncbi:glycosyltransferase [Brevibacterium casei]|uniref:glycosyltransferase n=1 Tax=Brevibacterium casei TaxID=33889 RepID=UPI003EB9A664
MSIEVSLVIPSYKSENYIEKCLDAVIAQDLNRSKFEIIIVINGPVDSTPEIVEMKLSSEKNLNWQVVYEETASLSNARNVGIRRSNGEYVTWVDVDDWLSTNYLREMLNAAEHGIVPLARVVDVDESTGLELESPITAQIYEHPPGHQEPEVLWRSLGFAACKLLSTADARDMEFDPKLKSGEDVAYFAPLFAKHKLIFDSTPAHNDATYYRLVRAGSMSRQGASFDFSVNQRLAVMKHLDRAALNADPKIRNVMHSMMRSQTLFAKRYLDGNPNDIDAVVSAFDRANLAYTPWNVLAGKTQNLAISYNFAPFADASAVVAAKRIVSSGKQWNVISNDMAKIRERDDDFHQRILPYISMQKTIANPPVFGSWKGVREFCESGLAAIAEIERLHGPQERLYSRSMWPASHFLAALKKIRNPEVEWIAEFSDPLRKDVRGKERIGPVVPDEYWYEIAEAVSGAGFGLDEQQSLFAACENIAYSLADTVFFTNPHQMSYMLSYLSDQALKSRVQKIAEIQPQPVPPPRFTIGTSPGRHQKNGDRINIGFYGSFYPNRGPGLLLDALQRLPEYARNRLKLHIFTPNVSDIKKAISELDLVGMVHAYSALPYLEFLKSASSMDLLLVADADTESTGHRLNPYLPSKLSDYRSTGKAIWGMYEPGSMLSRSNVDYLTPANDLVGTLAMLENLAKEQE